MTILQPTNNTFCTAKSTLNSGGIVAFATETVYGLGCDTFNTKAINLVYETKGRPIDNPMIAHILDVSWTNMLTEKWDSTCDKLAHLFWPGPLTIVLPKKETVPKSACGGRDTIAIRCPRHTVAKKLLLAFNKPISAPSANKSGYISPTTAQHVAEEFGEDVPVIDGGSCETGIESTVLSLIGEPTILRQGTILTSELEQVLGHIECKTNITQTNSPGTSKHHYSPHSESSLLVTDDINNIDDDTATVIMLFGSPKQAKECVQMPYDANKYGAALYHTLREADKQQPKHIYIEIPPSTPEWGAIQDRLSRSVAK